MDGKNRKRGANKGGPDCPGAFGVPSRGTAVLLAGVSLFLVVLLLLFFFFFFFFFFFLPLVLLSFLSLYCSSAATSSSSTALGMADQYVAVKKPVSPCLSSSSHLPRPPVQWNDERTNDQRNVNRKPREATLINPTEINCAVQRRSLAFSFTLALFSFFPSSALAGLYTARLAQPQKESRTIRHRTPRRLEFERKVFSPTLFFTLCCCTVEKIRGVE